jgi:hypothetical protein
LAYRQQEQFMGEVARIPTRDEIQPIVNEQLDRGALLALSETRVERI